MSGIDSRSHVAGRSGRVAGLAVAVVALAGMAYCHLADVGMKFHEHVYYMAVLFCCNIALSLALIPALILAETRDSRPARSALWGGTAGLAAATIAGFLWSRTIGFPQMEDHVGEWDVLGITSLMFEVALVVVSLLMVRRNAPGQPRADRGAHAAA